MTNQNFWRIYKDCALFCLTVLAMIAILVIGTELVIFGIIVPLSNVIR